MAQCWCVCTDIRVCWRVCARSAPLSCPHNASLSCRTATVIYVKILSFSFISPPAPPIAFVASPFLPPLVWSLSTTLPSSTVRLCPSSALSLPLSLLHASLPPSASLLAPPHPPLPHCRPVLISVSTSDTLWSLRLFVVTPPHRVFTALLYSHL